MQYNRFGSINSTLLYYLCVPPDVALEQLKNNFHVPPTANANKNSKMHFAYIILKCV